MNRKLLKTTHILRFAAIFAVLALSACAGGAVPGASNSGASSADALTGASIAALPQLGELFFTGTVQAMSATTVQIADMTFRVDDQTSWAQDLTVGSPVRVRALELPDRTRYAVDVQRADSLAASSSSSGEVEFKFYDVVVSMGAESWQIGSQTVLVDANTFIDAGIQTGSLVEVEGLLVNGQMLARKITLEDSGSQTPMPNPTVTPAPAGQARVELIGKLDAIDSTSLQVGGLTFAVTMMTEIDDNPVVGDIVKVEGFRAADGSLTAREVKLADFDKLPPEGTVYAEIKGTVETIGDSLWVIGGFNVAVNASTELYTGLAVGSFAKAEGTLQADGSLLAREIKPAEMDDDGGDDSNDDSDDDSDDDHGTPMPGTKVEFKGVVESISTGLWVIGGRTVVVTAQTRIEGSPQVGDYVEVKAYAANNTLTASQIELEDDDDGSSDDDGSGSGDDDDSNDDSNDDNGGDDNGGDDEDSNDGSNDDNGGDDDDDGDDD